MSKILVALNFKKPSISMPGLNAIYIDDNFDDAKIEKIKESLEQVIQSLDEMGLKIENLIQRKGKTSDSNKIAELDEAITAMQAVMSAAQTNLTQLSQPKYDPNTINSTIDAAIQKALPTIQHHRGYKEIVLNVAMLISGLMMLVIPGIIYLGIAAKSYELKRDKIEEAATYEKSPKASDDKKEEYKATIKNMPGFWFYKFDTDSGNKVNKLDQALGELKNQLIPSSSI